MVFLPVSPKIPSLFNVLLRKSSAFFFVSLRLDVDAIEEVLLIDFEPPSSIRLLDLRLGGESDVTSELALSIILNVPLTDMIRADV